MPALTRAPDVESRQRGLAFPLPCSPLIDAIEEKQSKPQPCFLFHAGSFRVFVGVVTNADAGGLDGIMAMLYVCLIVLMKIKFTLIECPS